jgi:alpha-tubulin suppressor-like RCC1 family protein
MASGNTKDDDVSVIGFGSNYFHALGGTEEISLAIVPQDESDNEGVEENSVPARILSDPPWKDNANLQQVVCSATATFFLTRDGHVYQTGTLHGIVATCPTRVQVPFPRKCVQISAGRHFCIAKLEQGIGVVSWGAGHFGQLGLGNHVSSLQTPQMIPALLPHTTLSNNANNNSTRVQQVAAGAWHALALLDNGTCMAWGSNRKLQCGIAPSLKSGGPPTLCTPQAVPFFGKFSKISAGRQHSLAIETETGRVYAWGASHFGQCGQYSRKSSVAPPRLVEALQKVVVMDIAAGDAHSLALTGGGRVFCWGSGMDGQLGLGGVVPLTRPKLICDLDFVAIQAGKEWKQQQQQQQPQFRSFDTDESSHLLPPTAYAESPAVGHLATVPKISQIYASGGYSAAVSSSGHLYTWGYNDGGQLGVPRSCTELPLVEVTSTTMKQSSSGRLLQVSSFESRHNVLLPRRVDALGDYQVKSVAVGPCNMWCIGTKRLATDENVIVGQTLWEVQEERRRKGLLRLRKNLSVSSSASVSSASGKMSPTIMSIQAISKDNVEQVIIPENVYAHKESTGLDEEDASTTTFETEQQSGIILPVQGEHKELPTDTTSRIQEPDRLESGGESLTITSVESPVSDGNVSSPSTAGHKKPPFSSPTSPFSKAKSFSNFISRRSRSRKRTGRSRNLSDDDVVATQEQQLNRIQFSASSTLATSVSAGPLGFAGGKPQLFANLTTGRRKTGRSQSVPSRRSTTPPPRVDWDGGGPATEPSSRARLGSVARLMRGRRNPKSPNEKKNPETKEVLSSAKKGRVRKALDCAFGNAK